MVRAGLSLSYPIPKPVSNIVFRTHQAANRSRGRVGACLNRYDRSSHHLNTVCVAVLFFFSFTYLGATFLGFPRVSFRYVNVVRIGWSGAPPHVLGILEGGRGPGADGSDVRVLGGSTGENSVSNNSQPQLT